MTKKILLAIAHGAKEAWNLPEERLWTRDIFSRWQSELYWNRENYEWAKKRREHRAIMSLKRRKFIEDRKIGNKIILGLTEKGKLAALKELIRSSAKCSDGHLVIASFDIPESERRVRTQVRRNLRGLGLVRLQNSVWSSDRDIGSVLSILVLKIGAEKWVRIFESKEIF